MKPGGQGDLAPLSCVALEEEQRLSQTVHIFATKIPFCFGMPPNPSTQVLGAPLAINHFKFRISAVSGFGGVKVNEEEKNRQSCAS